MRSFPIMLNVADRRVAVVGGGSVGLRKAQSLLKAGASVTLIAKTLKSNPKFLNNNRLTIILKEYRPSRLKGAMLVFACTDDAALNRVIARDARRGGALVNVADQPEDCDFFVPAVVARGEVVVAVGTGGASPALAGALRKKISSCLPGKIGAFAAALGAIRRRLKASHAPARRVGIMKRLAQDQAYRVFAEGGAKALRDHLAQLLE